jgi:tRNA (guanosine-2'-O-)-methyltransferase
MPETMTEAGKKRSITPRRLARMRGVLTRRQPGLTVVIENVHDPHNLSAVLRSCDAVGAASAHLVYTIEELPVIHSGVAASAQRWVDIFVHNDIRTCYEFLRDQGFSIFATRLSDDATDLYRTDLTRPTALVFGNETRGVSDEAARFADGQLIIPMMGMVESLNISVACAVSLFEAARQRREAGMYEIPVWDEVQLEARLRAWLEREDRDPEAAAAQFEDVIPSARNRYEHRT